MRFRTFAGVILALAAVVFVSYLVHLNFDLLQSEFALSATARTPLYVALLSAFLFGFLPTVAVLLTQTLRRDLAERRARRRSREGRSIEGAFRRAVDLRADGQWGKSLDELESVLADRPEDFSALLVHGEVLRQLGRVEEAVEVHRRAAVLYPRSVRVLYELVEDYRAKGDTDVATQIGDRVLRDFPGLGLRVLRARRDEALARSDWESAERFQERISALRGEGAESSEDRAVELGLGYQRAVAMLEGDRFLEAEKAVEEVLRREPRFVPALLLLGEVDSVRDRPDKAVQDWRTGFEVTGSPVFLQRIEDHFIERGQPIEAIDTLHQIINSSESP